MKYKYIESLLSEIQQLESKVANLKRNQNVSFSFFRESFKQTQEITRLLHELEFVQIEDMKGQMENLVRFLSESEDSKEQSKTTLLVTDEERDSFGNDLTFASHEETAIQTNSDKKIGEIDEKVSTFVESQKAPSPIPPYDATVTQKQEWTPPAKTEINNQKETIISHLNPINRSLNDIQPSNHTYLDTKRSISLNDRFLFQRELFNNSRVEMNEMLTKLQSFSSFDATENYMKENTSWNFEDETVDKFMQMLKDSFK